VGIKAMANRKSAKKSRNQSDSKRQIPAVNLDFDSLIASAVAAIVTKSSKTRRIKHPAKR
jgi:hypothetical protein